MSSEEPSTQPVPEPPPEPTPSRPTALGPYELLLELASGGMATVFLARAKDGRAVAPLVALKRPHRHLATDKNFLAMLLDEARLASAITHDNVVKVRELRFDDGEPSIVMDYVEGASLAELRTELVAAERAFDLKVALRIVLDALAGLHAAHELCDAAGKPLGIVHRDVSPHNVLVGSDGRARLTDFGVALASDRFQNTRTQEVKGKLAYLAPERVDRRRMCTRQSDIFAMAIVLWECIAGRRLFRGEQAVDTLQEVMHLPIPRLRQIGCDVPQALDDVIARGLSRDLEVRFATAIGFATALERAAEPSAIGTAEQVASLVEAICGERLAGRHAEVRRVLHDDAAADKLFDDAGLRRRVQGSAPRPPPSPDTLDAVAPLAPSERYAFGTNAVRLGLFAERPTRWALAGGIAAGLILGVGATVAVVTRSRGPAPPAVDPVAISREPVPSVRPPPSAWTDVPAAAPRHVVVRLPFLATHAVVDGADHAIAPPADVLLVDFPVEADTHHHVVATALEGSVAEADVIERNGIASARGAFAAVPSGPLPAASAGPATAPRVGTVHNGFTKLK